MHIAIVHYHLSPGGVTTVIRAESVALTGAGIPHVILCGREAPTDLPARVLEDLDYSEKPATSPASLLARLRHEALDALGRDPDVWHFHNPTLGKNILFPEVIRLLAGSGEKLLLHLHDLAEDGRPKNYQLIAGSPHLYPIAPNIRYAFINQRDLEVFLHSGMPPELAAIHPNPTPSPRKSPANESPPLVLYPTRGIRRKNLGELLLLSALAPPGTRFAISRAPENPSAKPIHDDWRIFAEKHALPVSFEVTGNTPPFPGQPSTFEAWLDAATHLATTSIAEGFGMIFNEAAAFGKPLIGRNLPTNPSGNHPALYDEILIPSPWIDAEEFDYHLTAALTETHNLYDQPFDRETITTSRSAIQRGDHFDFGNLPEPIQKQIITRIHRDPDSEPIIHGLPARRWLSEALSISSPFEAPAPPFAETLLTTLRTLHESDPSPPTYLDPRNILHAYLKPEHFHFLLTAPPKIRAVIFDIYGTLLISKSGAVRPDPAFDPTLTEILTASGYPSPSSPTHTLDEAVRKYHSLSDHAHPEIDLRELWKEILQTNDELTSLVATIEDAWHPVLPMPGALQLIQKIAADGVLPGLLSNAQSNTLPALDRAIGNVTPLFDPELTILSYRHRIAKPSPALFNLAARRLADRGIAPNEILFIGNDPLQDIIPASRAGFRTALFTGHPDSLRPGDCSPDLILNSLSDLPELLHNL